MLASGTMRVSPAVAFDAVTRVALAVRDPAPDAVFTVLEIATRETIGHRLFTLMVFDAGAGETERIYTSQPGPYPVGGRKRVTDTPWSRGLLREGTAYVGRTVADIRDVFFDHELILSLGCGSVLNVPVVWRGRVLGTMNLLHEEHWYTPEDAPLGLAFSAALVPVYLDRLDGVDGRART